MTALAILFALTVLLPLLGIGPPKRTGHHAANSVLFVTVPYATEQHARGVEAQETVEWWLAWLCGCVLALPAALALSEPLWANAGALVAAFAGNALTRALAGHFDLVGHNVEIMLAQEDGWTDYRYAEIQRMLRGDQRGMNASVVDANLRRWEWLARFALAAFKLRY